MTILYMIVVVVVVLVFVVVVLVFVVLVFVLCPSSHPHLMRATISSRAC
jgi:hypothetical protein